MENDYEVISTLGEGSFGKVYKARHRRTADEVAVKQIKIGSRSWAEACSSTELQALKALRHPFIVKLKELIRSQLDGSLYYIFEFLDSDLCRLLKDEHRGLEEMRAAELMRQLFAGLAHMHQHNFFHRDIKPENILLDISTETIRLADFGQARSLRARPPFTDYVGTRWYRSPECLLRDRTYSSPVDIWASGLIFAELLRGSPVFCGTSSIDQLYKIFDVLGNPLHDWPEFATLAQAIRFRVPDRNGCGLRQLLPRGTSPQCQMVLTEILAINPRRRPLARKCLENSFFSQLPSHDLDRLDTHRSRASRVQEPIEDDLDGKSLAQADSGATATTNGNTSRPEITADFDLDAELDAILGDRASPTGSRPARSFAGGLPDTLGEQPSLAQREESEPLPQQVAVPAPDVGAGGSSFAFAPGLRSRTEDAQRCASAPQGVPTSPTVVAGGAKGGLLMSPGGGVCVDALLDSLCADFPSPARGATSPRSCDSPPLPLPASPPPAPFSSLPSSSPMAPKEEPVPMPLSALPIEPSSAFSVLPATPGSAFSTVPAEPASAFSTLPVEPVSTSMPVEEAVTSLSPRNSEPEETIAHNASDEDLAHREPQADLVRRGSDESLACKDLEKENSEQEDAVSPFPLCDQAVAEEPIRRFSADDDIVAPEVEVPSVEVAWAGTPEKKAWTTEEFSSPEGSPAAWQPSARTAGRGLLADRAPLLPDSPGACSSKADSEAEILLPGIDVAPPTPAAFSEAAPIASAFSVAEAFSIEAEKVSSSVPVASLLDSARPQADAGDEAVDTEEVAAEVVPVEDPTLRELAALRAENAALRERIAAEAIESKASGAAVTLADTSSSSSALQPPIESNVSASALGIAEAKMQPAAPEARSSSSTTAAVAMPSTAEGRTALKSRGSPWTSDEAGQLRRLVKRIIRKGSQDREALWSEVSADLANGRSARECKLQYARDYRAHKAKTAEVKPELTDTVTTTSACGFDTAFSSQREKLSGCTGNGRPLQRLQAPEPLFQSGMALSQSAM